MSGFIPAEHRRNPEAQFQVRVEHRYDEPVHGLLVRTAGENGCVLYPALFKRFGANQNRLVGNIDIAEVAHVCSADVNAVRFASSVTVDKHIHLMGQILNRDYTSTQFRRWCPDCLNEDPYHRAWWDVLAVSSCPYHGKQLVDDCGCGRKLLWHAQSLTGCKRGHDLRAVEAPLRTHGGEADRYIVERLTNTRTDPNPLLDALALGDAITAMKRVGRALLAENSRISRNRDEVAAPELMNEGFRILSSFSTAFPLLLDELAGRHSGRKGKWGMGRAYGNFQLWVSSLVDDAFGTALKTALADHAAKNLTLKTGYVVGGEKLVVVGYTFEEAEKRCGISYARLRRILESKNMLPPTVQGRPVRLDQNMIDALAFDLQGGMSLKAVAAELGIAHEAATGLIKAGMLQPVVAADQAKRLSTYIFGKNTSEEFLQPLLNLANTDAAGEGFDLNPLPQAAQQARTTVASAVSFVLTGKLLIRAVDASGIGLCQMMVSPREIAKLLLQQRMPGLTIGEAAARLGLPYNCMTNMEEQKALVVDRTGKTPFITEAEVDRFKRTYIAVPDLTKMLGLSRPRDAIERLRVAGLEPACSRPRFRKVLYLRDQAEALVKEITTRQS